MDLDVTNRPTGPVNNEATIRVNAPQAAQAGAPDITVRPGTGMQQNDDDNEFRDGDFVLKGRFYRTCAEGVLSQLHHQEGTDAHHPEFQSGDGRQDYRLW